MADYLIPCERRKESYDSPEDYTSLIPRIEPPARYQNPSFSRYRELRKL
ncbi:hypothetical protein HYZ97_01355 [Candidatus Pacearchaeota archaeon]|nr:hypothetical protein [Candidatus Pacearchaeota archaeon]